MWAKVIRTGVVYIFYKFYEEKFQAQQCPQIVKHLQVINLFQNEINQTIMEEYRTDYFTGFSQLIFDKFQSQLVALMSDVYK